ncbi:HypA-like protein, putative [Talaromyces stipitatus ATCC 10500]|uniref:HypA-like protein, putative n=1 Tax=Talaromyces stipitatus (strain ATCC 10500 / CBS 375.48 / QM 6759 / NRRL 1006) TaxID=441959 RepID=B8MDJ7_TALSN|nr:HypA-like protein, putative [Talaromyces stipitatus ATCC 10500]EED17960.1 HypA-like protein, putative [Talaromyces stipitatus ATCC 10500]
MGRELLILPRQLRLIYKLPTTVKTYRGIYNMATATQVKLSTSDAGVFSHKPREDSAQRASELLQRDMKEHHIFFNEKRFHNHIVHHLLTLFSLGASPEEIQDAYDRGHSYQRKAYPVDNKVVHAIIEKSTFKDYLGKEEHYSNFLAFFQQEISTKGVAETLQEHIFAEDEHADDLLGRLFSGLIHPIIHLGFGIEFNQPAIIAEGLAEAAVHEGWVRPYLQGAEDAAGGIGSKPGKTLTELVHELRQDEEILSSVRHDDANQMRDGVLKRTPEKMKHYAKQYTVSPETLKEQLAEMINALIYIAAASQHPPNVVKYEFILIHAVNCSIFFSAILDRPWISTRAKVRLLEWKGRMDLLLYASRHCPPLYLSEVTSYSIAKTWDEVIQAGNTHKEDDGHVVKLIRAIAHGEQITDPLEKQGKAKGLKMHGNAWLKAANMGSPIFPHAVDDNHTK